MYSTNTPHLTAVLLCFILFMATSSSIHAWSYTETQVSEGEPITLKLSVSRPVSTPPNSLFVPLFRTDDQVLPPNPLDQDGHCNNNGHEPAEYTCGENATACRLIFDEGFLPENVWVTLSSSSEKDKAKQTFDKESLEAWDNKSAYFNGRTILLHACANENHKDEEDIETDAQHEAQLKKIQANEAPNQNAMFNATCVNKIRSMPTSRQKSSHTAIGNSFPQNCTVTIAEVNDEFVFLTAGHCVTPNMQLLQLNSPGADTDGNPQHPPPELQFPIKSKTTCGLDREQQYGHDWAVLTVGKNAKGQSVKDVDVVTNPFSISIDSGRCVTTHERERSIAVIGYHSKYDTSRTNWFSQRTSQGTAFKVLKHEREYSRYFNHTAITAPGSSGSAIVAAGTNTLLGIHTDGLCNNNEPSGIGVSFDNEHFCSAVLGKQLPEQPPSNCASLFEPSTFDG